MSALLALALLLIASSVAAQPTSITVAPPVTDATGATFAVTWSGGTFAWSGGYSDGTAFQQGTSASPLMLRMPYHASGAAASGWVCVMGACAGFTVPAKPTTPPATSNQSIQYTEPTTSDCTGKPQPPCSTVLNDLAAVRLYWRLDGGLENGPYSFPVSGLTGGATVTQTLTIPAVTGVLTVQATAVDTGGNESARSGTATKTLGATKPLPAGSGTLQLTR